MENQEKEVIKNDEYYWNQFTPAGTRYSIPLLDASKASYKRKYIEYMKLREKKPQTFEKILNWD
jgi:hypothetical protein